MCGRYSLAVSTSEIESWFKAELESGDFSPTWNAAPGQVLPVMVRRDRSWLRPMRWGFQVAVGSGSSFVINARTETVGSKSSFKHLANGFRCVIPSTGFYEWQKRGGEKIPYYIHFPDLPVYGMAGIYRPETLEQESSFLILTTEPKGIIRSIHDRMPLVLDREGVEEWLDGGMDVEVRLNLTEQARGFRAEAYTVSNRVNRVGVNGPELVREERHEAPWTLFD